MESANKSMWNGDRKENSRAASENPQPHRQTDDAAKKRTYPMGNPSPEVKAAGKELMELLTVEQKLEAALKKHYGENNPANLHAYQDIRDNILWPAIVGDQNKNS